MTTIFEKTSKNRPQTHFFVVGVGAYRHVSRGSAPQPRMSRELKSLIQLSSAPTSARAFLDWVFKEFNNPDVPLGSVEFLVSPVNQDSSYTTPDGAQHNIESATLSNIRAAFNRWFDRCDLHADNIAVFYFCGHGIELDEHILLAEDFGEHEGMLFENAINFTRTYRGMASCKAKKQWYFIDTCRQVSKGALQLTSVNARVLRSATFDDPLPEDAPILYATTFGESAYGLSDQNTRFTEALIKSLQGLGTKPAKLNRRARVRDWVVTANQLVEAMNGLLEQGNKQPNVPYQQCTRKGEGPGTSILNVLKEPPSVPVTIDVDPSIALSCAELVILRGTAEHQRRSPPKSTVWQLMVPAGTDYEARVGFPSGQYQEPSPETVWAMPPNGDEVVFEVESIL